jgi:hypothetical protein
MVRKWFLNINSDFSLQKATDEIISHIYYIREKSIYSAQATELITTFLLEDVSSSKMKRLHPFHPLLHQKILNYDFH